MTKLKLIISVLLLALLSINVSALSVAIEQPDCSHIQVTTDPGAYVDILYNGEQGWGPIYSGEKADSNGRVIKPTIFNGTHKATAGTFPGRVSASSPSIQVTTCEPPKTCTSKSDCASGEICSNSVCTPGECAINDDCADAKFCDTSSHSCAPISCICGKIENHACTKYQCCSNANCTGGKICVSNSCVENTTGGPQTDPAKVSAQSAISDAQSAINSAKAQGKNVASAEAMLSQANSKFSSADYSGAENLAKSAKQNALASTATNPGSNTSANPGAGSGGGPGWFSSGIGLACVGGVMLFFIFIIGLFIVIALVAAFFKRK